VHRRLASAVYEGVVRHRRHSPQPHAFRYRMAQLYLDLEEIEQVFEGTLALVRGPAQRRGVPPQRLPGIRADRPLIEAVRDCAEQRLGRIARKGPCVC
jgi:hypothetical protein